MFLQEHFSVRQCTYNSAASQKLPCFLETLARFRPDLSLLAELNEIEGENDFFPLGCVPHEWCAERLLGSACVEGNYADIYAAEWIALLRRWLAGECLRLGLSDLDAFALVAMGAVFGAASRATFSFIIFAFEITRDYNSVLPLMLVAVIADGIAMLFMPNSSIMTEKLARAAGAPGL